MSLRPFLTLLALCLATGFAGACAAETPASADPENDLLEITVGLTPNCPYVNPSCWTNAAATIRQLPEVMLIADQFDAYNSTLQVWIRRSAGLPDLAAWQSRFQKTMGANTVLRGVELTLEGDLSQQADGTLALHWAPAPQPIALVPLMHKLQWNFGKKHARGLEEEEKEAFQQLTSSARAGGGAPIKVRVTGVLQSTAGQSTIEVREFYLKESPR